MPDVYTEDFRPRRSSSGTLTHPQLKLMLRMEGPVCLR